MILDWWKNQGPSRYDQIECLTMTAVTGASFTITNATPLRHCFDCHPAWCVCWPAYCLIAIPYKIWRNLVNGVHDVMVKMAGNVMVAHPSSHGYELENFFRKPIKNTQPGVLETSERTAMGDRIEKVQAKSIMGNPRMRMSLNSSRKYGKKKWIEQTLTDSILKWKNMILFYWQYFL